MILLDTIAYRKSGKHLFPKEAQKPNTLKLVTVKLPEKLIDDMDQLVKAGIYHSRSDAIRDAVRNLLRRELWQTAQS